MKNVVAELIETHGMRYEEIAVRLDCSMAAVWKWHRKKREPKRIYLKKLNRMLARFQSQEQSK